MCGRYATTRSAADLSALFEALDETRAEIQAEARPGAGQSCGAGEPDQIRARFNVAPTDPAPVVRHSLGSDRRVLSVGRWGLLPHWAKDPKAAARMINARVETVATAPAYRDAFATRRALVPVDGWYEWRRDPARGRQAFFMTPRDGSVLALAGLWSRWGPAGLLTFSVLTTAAIGELVGVHDRMPLALPPSYWDRWLAGPAPDRLDPPPPAWLAGMEIRPVGPAVGNVRNDGPDLVKRVDLSGMVAPVQPTLF